MPAAALRSERADSNDIEETFVSASNSFTNSSRLGVGETRGESAGAASLDAVCCCEDLMLRNVTSSICGAPSRTFEWKSSLTLSTPLNPNCVIDRACEVDEVETHNPNVSAHTGNDFSMQPVFANTAPQQDRQDVKSP